ncbi:thiamine phosphate synthase [Akkermansia sp.]|uniref:thiamine phosphate synthase n=1 Tax=Akkermansia sp. TaxID=1872421 RepID=UPI003A9047F7
MNRKERLSSCRLYGIADMGYTAEHQLISVTEKLLAGGLGILQLRAKNHDPEHIARMGSRLAPLCREYGCLFIINDYPEIALGTGADGVHLGQDDGELAPVRAMLGANAIIGRSTHSPEQALGAFREQADYIGFGPLFPTGTKPGRPAIGLEDIAGVRRQLPEEFPVFCIGGINGNTLPSVLEAGASRVVIVSWLLTHPDITETVAALRKRLGEA